MKASLGIVIAVAVLSALALAGCGAPAATPVPPVLEGKQWRLVSYMTANGTVDVLPDTEIISVFRNGDIDGTGSCNNHGGTYAVNGDKVVVKAGDTTVELCSEAVMAQEKVFLAALNSAASFKLVGNQLQVFDGGGYEVLTYRAVEP